MEKTLKTFVRLPLEQVTNCRDLGGYATLDGQMTQWQRFLRSSGLHLMTDSDIQNLKNFGLKTVIDLRSPAELANEPNPFASQDEVTYINVNLIGEEEVGKSINDKLEDAQVNINFMGNRYVDMLANTNSIKAIFDAILNAEDGTILYHCTAGKDRTGIVSALLLGLVEVDMRDIVSNYEVSFTNIEAEIMNKVIDTKYPLNVMQSNPGNMKVMLQYLLDEYGSVASYFEHIGFTTEEVQVIKNKLIK